MTELVLNKYGVEFDHIKIKRLRIFRLSKKWLVEYQREPRWPLGLDRWWWFNDGIYVDYEDALKRVEYLRGIKYVSTTHFQKVKTFEIDE